MKGVTVTYKDYKGKSHTESAVGTDAYRLLECIYDDGGTVISEEWKEYQEYQ